MKNSDAEGRWLSARNLEELAELTALWIEGTLPFHPCYGEAVDDETQSLRTVLAHLNRGGLMTTCSQPAVESPEGSGQRAFVEAFAREPLAKELYTLGLSSDLLVFAFPPGTTGGYQVPITVWDFHPHTWVGASLSFEELESFRSACSPEAIADLKRAWYVVVIDPEWGREDHLWQQTSAVVDGAHDGRFSSIPSDDLALDTDFVC